MSSTSPTQYSPFDHQVLALAGIFQHCLMVESLAKTGHAHNKDMETAVSGLFCQNPASPMDVFGKISNLEAGLTRLLEILQRKSGDHKDVVRYVMGIMHLQKQLVKRNDMLGVIGQRLEKSQQQSELFSSTHENVLGSLADIYTDTISQLSFRIQVMGEYNYLQQARVANQIRVLLFAAIRSAVLWRQLGGNRLQVILKRQDIVKTTRKLIDDAKRESFH